MASWHDSLSRSFWCKESCYEVKVLQPWVGQVLNTLFHDNVITLFWQWLFSMWWIMADSRVAWKWLVVLILSHFHTKTNCRFFLDLRSNRTRRIICAYCCLQETNILLKCTLKQVVQYILSLTQSSGLAWVRIPEHNNIAGMKLTSCAGFRKIILVNAKE